MAFTRDGDKPDIFDIYIKLVGPGTPLRLTTDPARDGPPAWSPDGRSIAFLRAGRGSSTIVVIPALGGPERKIAEGAFQGGLCWSRNAQWLLT